MTIAHINGKGVIVGILPIMLTLSKKEACWWQPPTLTLVATIVEEEKKLAATFVEEEMSLAATIDDKGARGAAIDAYKRGMILESKV